MTAAPQLATPLEDLRQCWRTPRPLFTALHERYVFEVDAAADDSNHLLPSYWTIRDNGIERLFFGRERAYVNPPYDNVAAWIDACRWRCMHQRAFSALLLPSRTDQKWFHLCAMDGEIHFVKGRIAFDAPSGIASSSNREGSVLVVFDPVTFGRRVVGAISSSGEVLR